MFQIFYLIEPTYWTVSGILLDIVGVLVLAFEVYRSVAGSGEFLSERDDHTKIGAGGVHLGPAPVYDTREHTPWTEVDWDNMDRITKQAFDAYFEEQNIHDFSTRANNALDGYSQTLIVPRRRRLIVTGAAFIVAGFCLQIVGAIL